MKKSPTALVVVIAGAAILSILMLGLVFYWFAYRPSSITSACSSAATERAMASKQKRDGLGYKKGTFLRTDREYYYGVCLQDHGIEK